MKKVFMNNEPYAAPEITLVEVMVEQGFAQTTGGTSMQPETGEGSEGEWDNEGGW